MSRVPNQNGVSQACYMVEIYHSGPEPMKCVPGSSPVSLPLWIPDQSLPCDVTDRLPGVWPVQPHFLLQTCASTGS